MNETSIVLYTTTLCPDCWRVKSVLRKLGVTYVEVDILKDPEGGEDMARRSGQRHVPTLVLPDGTVLIEPDNLTLIETVAPLIH